MMLRYCMSSCTSSHTWCYATVCRLALPHIYDATLLYVVLHFLTYMMLRYCMSSCTSSHIWCYATVCRLALPHIYDATLVYVVLHFLMRDLYQNLEMSFERNARQGSWEMHMEAKRVHGTLFHLLLAVEMGKQFPQKVQAHCRHCQEHLAQKKRDCRWGFLHFQLKVRAYFLRKLNFQGDAKPLWFVV